MAATGGDILEVTYNHPRLGTGTIFAKSNEDSNYDLGGFRSNDDVNMIDGGGRMINQMNRVRWSFEFTAAWDMNDTEELNRLTQLIGDPLESDWTFSHSNGTIWQGRGIPVGDMVGNGNAATIPVKVSGGGVLQKL